MQIMWKKVSKFWITRPVSSWMVEGGKIDWACHANDAGATITDTVALDEAVGKAVEFYNEHPDETLILVTGDPRDRRSDDWFRGNRL